MSKDDDIDAILAAVESAVSDNKGKKGKGKGKGPAPAQPKKEEPKPEEKAPAPADGAEADGDDGDDGPDEGGAGGATGKMNKNKLKKLKAKEKAKAAKEAEAAGGADAGEAGEEASAKPAAPAAPAAGGKGGKPPAKVSAAKQAILDRIAAQKAAEELARKMKEEEERRYKEELARLEAEEKARQEEKERKRKEESAKREEMRKRGELLSKSELAKKQANERFLAQMAAAGLKIKAAEIPAHGKGEGQETPEESDEKDKHQQQKKKVTKPMKTKAQLEAERIRAEAAKIEAEKVQMKHQALEMARKLLPDLAAKMDEADALLQKEEDSLKELNTEIDQVQKDVDALDAEIKAVATAEPAELDDWDAEPEDGSGKDKAGELIEKKEKLDGLLAKQKSQLEVVAKAREAKVISEKEVMIKQEELEKKLIAEAEEKRRLEEEEAERKRREAEESESKSMTHNPNSNLRSPICVILGHVDSGKTSLLDRIRNSSVQKGEAGGITQQIGATFIPISAVKDMTSKLDTELNFKLPGLLVIDTPGHESFTNLRSRGADLCDMAILVVDITKGLQQQTLESIELLRMRKTPFVVAVTKVDTLYGWKKGDDYFFNPIQKSLTKQTEDTQYAFEKLIAEAKLAFAEKGLNTALAWENTNQSTYVSMVPVSSKSGEGIPDLLSLICNLTQSMMAKKLTHQNLLQCTVLEVKVLEGYGTTIDVILVNGELREGDTIVLSGMAQPVVTKIRALLTPPPLRELRIKSEYIQHKVVRASMGLKIAAPDLQDVLAGSPLFVCGPKDNIEELQDAVQSDLQHILARRVSNGVFVHASSLGSLEALMSFLKDSNIPISDFDIGTVHKVSITKVSTQLQKRRPEYAVLLAFDVKIEADAQQMADRLGIKIFHADIIYHLKDQCEKHFAAVREKQKQQAGAVFPVVIKMLGKDKVFRNTDPIVMGVRIVAGTLRKHTPLFVPKQGNVVLGRVAQIMKDKKAVDTASKDDEVSIEIDQKGMDHPPMFGRHFVCDTTDQPEIFSHMQRSNIDTLNEYYKDEITDTDRKLIAKFIELKIIQ